MTERSCDAVGIDLGTTYSALAYLDAQKVPRIVPDSSGNAVTPSVIFFDDDEIIVGDIAVQQSKLRSDRVVQFVKIHMGDDWKFHVNGQVHSPESLSGIILAHLIREAEPTIGPIRSAVITVPAYFTEKRRRATQQAGEIAGLTVIGTLNEPMAAAISYGLHHENKEQTVLVYDLGGGTFDVTIVRISPNSLEELAIAGNRQLGGKDWDQCLIDMAADDFARHRHVDLRKEADAVQAMQDLQLECERAKRRLTRMAKTSIRIQALGHDHQFELTRGQFEEGTAHLLQSSKLTMQMALEDAKLTWKDLSRVVLIGGSTNMPMVRIMLKDTCGVAPDVGINPVTAVALGASIYAQILETGKGPKTIITKDPEKTKTATNKTKAEPPTVDLSPPANSPSPSAVPNIRFVTAHGVGVRAVNQLGKHTNIVLIPKNTRVPFVASRQFRTRTTGPGQATRINIEVTQGDTRDLELAERLGTAMITGIPANEPSGQPVTVTMKFDDQGRLHLEALYVNTGQILKLALEIPGGLKEEQVRKYRNFLEKTGLISTIARPPQAKPPKAKEEELPILEDEDDDDIDFLPEDEDDDDDIPLLEPAR